MILIQFIENAMIACMEENVTNEDLARMIAKGFEETAKEAELEAFRKEVDQRFEQVDKRFEQVDTRLAHVDSRLDMIERDMRNLVHRDEFEDLMARVKYVEMKLGIESGR